MRLNEALPGFTVPCGIPNRGTTVPCGSLRQDATYRALTLPGGTTEQPVPTPCGMTQLGRPFPCGKSSRHLLITLRLFNSALDHTDPCGMTLRHRPIRALAADLDSTLSPAQLYWTRPGQAITKPFELARPDHSEIARHELYSDLCAPIRRPGRPPYQLRIGGLPKPGQRGTKRHH